MLESGFKRTDEELLRKQKQKESFMSRLKIVAMDLRDLPAPRKTVRETK